VSGYMKVFKRLYLIIELTLMYIIALSIWFFSILAMYMGIFSEKHMDLTLFVGVLGASIFTTSILLYSIYSVRKFDKYYKERLYNYPAPGHLLYQVGFTNPFSYKAMIRFPFYRGVFIYVPIAPKKNKKNHMRYELMPDFEKHITWLDKILYIGGVGMGGILFFISCVLVVHNK